MLGASPSLDGIIVGGDIAFSARPAEYEEASRWLEQVLTICRLDESRIWVVPGNHDVSWAVVDSSPVAKDFRNALKTCSSVAIERELRSRLFKDPAGQGVMLPFEEYNTFAQRFGCGTTAEQPHWFDETLVCDGLSVRLAGINSAIVSDRTDCKESDQCKLVIGKSQCILPRKEGLIQVAIIHHPPPWLRDWELIEPYVRRAHLVLFGHEHRRNAEQHEHGGSVYLYAGAVCPDAQDDSQEDDYLPSWSLLEISRHGEMLRVEQTPRVWSRAETRFGSFTGEAIAFDIVLDLFPQVEGAIIDQDQDSEPTASAASPLATSPIQPMNEMTSSGAERRLIGVRFMSLVPGQRLKIARELGVLDEPEDFELPTTKLYEVILTRIRERGLIARLKEELDRA